MGGDRAPITDQSTARYRRILATSATGVSFRAIALLCNLMIVRLLISELGVGTYSAWAVTSSAVSLLALSDFGLGAGTLNRVTYAAANDADAPLGRTPLPFQLAASPSETAIVASSAFTMLSVLGLICLAVTIAGAATSAWLPLLGLSSAEALLPSLGLAVPCVFAVLAVDLPLATVQHVRNGLQEGYFNYAFAAVGTVAAVLLLFCALQFGAPLPAVFAIAACGTTIGYLINVIGFLHRHPALRPRVCNVRRRVVRELAHAGGYFFVLQASAVVAFSTGSLIAAHLFGTGAVASYALPLSLVTATTGLLAAVSSSFWPAYGDAIARGDTEWAYAALRRCLLGIATLSSTAALAIFVFGPKALHLLTGQKIPVPNSLLVGLCLWLVVSSIGHALALFLAAANVVKIQAMLGVVMAIVNVPLSILLAREIGLAGLVWSTVLSYGIVIIVPSAILLPRALQSRLSPVR